ncbi:MAG: TIGR01777 family protein [Verrucomicrobia bacterium]|nr:MAG: TIGR01777 family protein [Verrucomicrobiota bacterium]
MKPKRIIIAGGSGFLGRLLAKALAARGDEVVVLTRRPGTNYGAARAVFWDGRTLGPWSAELDGAHAVVNMAGKNVSCRYTTEALREINASRVDSVHVIGDAIRRCARPPAVWVQTGSLAIYGDAGDRECDENAPAGEGIPADTCRRWEQAFADAPTPDTRRVWLRISFVLGRSGGALRLLEALTRWYLGGSVGNGKQYISWIHEEDMVRLFLRAIDDPSLTGVYNATGPEPVTNAEFMRELRRVLHRPWSPPTPAWAVPIGCWFMRTEPVLALTGRRGIPKRLAADGFNFRFPRLPDALAHLYQPQNPTL